MNLHGHGHTRIIYIYESMYVYMSARQSVRTWRHAKLLQVLCTLLRIALWKRSQKERHSFCRWAKLQTHIRSFRTKAWRLWWKDSTKISRKMRCSWRIRAVSWTFRVSRSCQLELRQLRCQIRDAVGQIAEVKAVILRRWALMLGVVGRIFMCWLLYYYEICSGTTWHQSMQLLQSAKLYGTSSVTRSMRCISGCILACLWDSSLRVSSTPSEEFFQRYLLLHPVDQPEG